MEVHAPANKDGENLEKSGILRRRRFSRGDGTTNSSQRGAIIEADAGSIRLNTKLHPQTSQVHGRRLVECKHPLHIALPAIPLRK